jgi:hypothetical protein
MYAALPQRHSITYGFMISRFTDCINLAWTWFRQ